ncbi:kinetochore scaffold 1 isoform X2 [Pseudophryne corroboree]|uniref:kinetochore scaffold 1 isoform X2 n=1 Tax=Pseudophryne corroboree TaxID=495146 RepID=UPI0030818A76
MDGNDLTERSRRRRISSILKAPRSPLRDLGYGNELYQDSTLEKRRKSSRRVSFAETIRVFTPEPPATAAADTKITDPALSDTSNNHKNSTCEITGINTLLHGPIQVPAHQAEWIATDCTKDRTILFSSDMDMTTSNTIAIDRLVEATPKKIDTGLFLSSLKSPKSEESTGNIHLPFSISGQNNASFEVMTNSSCPTKMKFEDFLATLGNNKSKTVKTNTTMWADDADKENIFPYVPKENISNKKSIPALFYALENTGDVTQMFREQENGLDLTKCQTTNITTFIPMFKREWTNNNPGSTCADPETQTLHNCQHLVPSGIASKSYTNDQTVLMKDDMDLTCSHTTRIDGELWQPRRICDDSVFLNDRTIIFTNENEMELTKNNVVLLNSIKTGALPVAGEKSLVCMERTTVFPDEEMDITNSHTVAIDGLAVDQMRNQTSTYSSSNKVLVTCETPTNELPFNVSLAENGGPNNCVNRSNGPGAGNPQGRAYEISKMETSKLEEQSDLAMGDVCNNNKNSTCQITGRNSLICGPIQVSAHQDEYNTKDCTRDRSCFFSCDNDMDMTTSNTIAIVEAKPKKIDTGLFLSSLKSQKSEESTRKIHFPFSVSDLKNASFQLLTDSSCPTRIEFGELATLGNNNKSKTVKTNTTVRVEDADKENVFPSVPKENRSNNKSVPPFFHALENIGDVTHLFREQENGLDLTKCQTTNITTFIPMCNRDLLNTNNPGITCTDRASREPSVITSKSYPNDQTVLKDDMDLTCSPTTRIDGVLWQPRRICDDDSVFPNDKTIIFTNENEMELTKNNVVLFNSIKAGALPVAGEKSLVCMERTTVFPDEEMDITNSHTVAIDILTVDQMRNQTSTYSSSNKVLVMCKTPQNEVPVNVVSHGEKGGPNNCVNHSYVPGTGNIQGRAYEISGKEASKQGEQSGKAATPFCLSTANSASDLDQTKAVMDILKLTPIGTKNTKSQTFLSCTSAENPPIASTERTILFTGDQDDMEFTTSHPIAIVGKYLQQSSKTSMPNRIPDMDMTQTHTVAIETNVFCEGEDIHNTDLKSLGQQNFAIHSAAANNNVLVCSQEMIKSHTIPLNEGNVHNLPVPFKSSTNTMDLEQVDMDITKSNTIFIGNIPENEIPCDRQISVTSKCVQSSKRITISSNKNVNKVGDITNTSGGLLSRKNKPQDLENITRMFMAFQDKTRFPFDQNDMDMTKSHTIAIESMKNRLRDDLQINPMSTSKNALTELEDTVERTESHTVVDQDDPVTDYNKSVNTMFSKDVDMDNTKSNTVFIDHLSDNLQNKEVQVSGIYPKGNRVYQNSFDANNETVDVYCNVEEAKTNFELANAEEERFVCKASLGKTIYNQEDMERRRSHTGEIESKHLQDVHINGPVHANVSTCDHISTSNTANFVCEDMYLNRSHSTRIENTHSKEAPSLFRTKASGNKDLSLVLQDTAVTCSGTGEKEITNFQGKAIFTAEYIDTHLLPTEETLCTNEQEPMEITKAHTVMVEVKMMKAPNYQGLTPDICTINGETEEMDIVKTSTLETERHETFIEEPMEMLEQPVKKSISRSTTALSKTVQFLEDLENMELTQVRTMQIEGVSGEIIGSSGRNSTCVISDEEIDITKSNTVFIDQKCEATKNSLLRNVDMRNVTRNLVTSICNEEIPEEDTVSSNKSEICNVSGLIQAALKCNSKPLDIRTENLTVDMKIVSDHKLNDIRSLYSDSCGLPCELAVTDHIHGLQTSTSVPQKDPEELQDNMVSKKAKRRSKRVSFHIPEKKSVIRDDILKPSTAIPMPNQEEQFSLVPGEHYANSQVERENIPVPVNIEISYGKSDFTNNTLIQSTSDNKLNLKGLSNFLENAPDASTKNLTVTDDICSVKDNKSSRSIADIQLKIKSLTQNTNTSVHQTAPVSCFIEQLPTTSHISYRPNTNEIPEQVLLNTDLSCIVLNEGEKNDPLEERDVIITKETCLPNRLSVKIFQPRLPTKRYSSTSNTQERISSSAPKAQAGRTSMTLLKALTSSDDVQCIEEEILPVCPDDQEINSLFQYDVPEGAWEELCKKEALHKNLKQCAVGPEETITVQKRIRDTEDDVEIQREKKAKRNETSDQVEQTSVANKSPSYRSDLSHTSKAMEKTYCSSSSQDSKGEGMSVDLSSQQYSQMDSQLPWDSGCEQTLWQKFQDGTITTKEFFILLRIRILIQKPRYSELPANLATNEAISSADVLLDQYIYQPKLQVYEEECHSLYQTIEELKVCVERQEKPLVQINNLLWEALRMCSENELMFFGVKLKNLKAMYSKKSKLLAHERKVTMYGKLLHTAQVQWEQFQRRISETDKLIEELDDCISNLEMETAKLDKECRNPNLADEVPCGAEIRNEIEHLKSVEQDCIGEILQLKERKEHVLTQLGSLQAESRDLDKHLDKPSFTEWDLIEWTDEEATFVFLYDSLQLKILFGDYANSEQFNNQPCRRISTVILESQLNEEIAPPSTLLVHRLIMMFIERKGSLHKTYKTQNNLPQLLFDVSLVVSRCKLLGEEIQYLTKWGAKYNLMQTQIQSNEVRLLFSSLAAIVKFELIVHLSESYPTAPLPFTLVNRIGNIDQSRVTAVMSKVPVGLWHLKRAVKSIHENLLV